MLARAQRIQDKSAHKKSGAAQDARWLMQVFGLIIRQKSNARINPRAINESSLQSSG
jgi:hypothetical protein